MRSLLSRLWHSPTFMTWGSLGSRLLGLTLVLPMVLVRFAPADVAVWQLFATLVTLMLILDFGLSPTFSRMLSYALGGATLDDLKDIRRSNPRLEAGAKPHADTVGHVYATLLWLYARLGLVILALAAVVGTLTLRGPMSQLQDPQSGWLAWGVVLFSLVGAVWGNAYASALQGLNEIARLRRWEIASSIGQIASSFAVVACGGGLLTLVVSTQAWALFNVWRNRRLLHSLHPELAALKARPHPDVVQTLWPAAWRSGVGVLMSQGIIQASGLAYGQLAGAADVAAYLLALRMITTVSQFSQAPFYSKLPALGICYAQKNIAEQLRIAQRGMLLASGVFTLGSLAVGLTVQPLLGLIHSKVHFVSGPVWVLLSFAFFVERVGAMHIQLYSVTNHIVWHIANGVTGATMLGLAWLLFPHLGIAAFPAAMLVAYSLLYTAYAMYLTSSTFKFKLLAFEARASLPSALVQLLGGGLIYLASK